MTLNCKICSLPKLRILVGHKGKEKIFKDELGHRWYGHMCHVCYKLKLKAHMQLKRSKVSPETIQ